MKTIILSLRADLQRDREAWAKCLRELHGLDLSRADASAIHRAAALLLDAYAAVESALQRVARTVEGALPPGADTPSALLDSMATEVDGVRPRVLSSESLRLLRNLSDFCHALRECDASAVETTQLEAKRAEMISLHGPLEQDLEELERHLAQIAGAP